MALFIQKPIFWNSDHYIRPSGAKAISGYPEQWGYGHEEWNNSPRLKFSDMGCTFRAFHTEQVGNAPLVENSGQTFVFLTASHDGVQQLVGIAGNAFGLMDERFRPRRLNIAKRLNLQDLFSDVWSVARVRKLHDKAVVRRQWNSELGWLINWICPDEYFLWLEEPVTIDAPSLTGKSRLLSMFSSYTLLDRTTALSFLDLVPRQARNQRWVNLADAMNCAPAQPLDPHEALQEEPVTATLTKINARRGQGKFRADLFERWHGSCAVTRLNQSAILRASHVKPWKDSSNSERLDPDNGLLLVANLDALFDAGLVTFTCDGEMLVSSQVDQVHQLKLNIPEALSRKPSAKLAKYLEFHREHRFRR